MGRGVPKLLLLNNFSLSGETLMDLQVILHERKIQVDFGKGLEIGNIRVFLNDASQKEERN